MPRVPHRIGLAAVFATAALTGTVALSQTVDLGADASEPVTITKKELKKRTKAVKQNDVKLAQALKQRPPALPERPKFDPLPAPVAPPVVVTRMVSAPSNRRSCSTILSTTDQSMSPYPDIVICQH